jgi:hypothetical protein
VHIGSADRGQGLLNPTHLGQRASPVSVQHRPYGRDEPISADQGQFGQGEPVIRLPGLACSAQPSAKPYSRRASSWASAS